MVRQKLTQWLDYRAQCKQLERQLKQQSLELEQLKLDYNRLEFDDKSIEERKSLLKLLGNERIDRTIQYLEKFKFELVKDVAKVTTDILYIRMRDG